MPTPATGSNQLAVTSAEVAQSIQSKGSVLDQIRERSLNLDRSIVVPKPPTPAHEDTGAQPELTPAAEIPAPELEAKPIAEPVSEETSLPAEAASEPEPVPVAENMKRLRNMVGELNKTVKSKDQELQTVTTKLKEFETGKIVPEVLQEKENEIARLSKYEKLHNLKFSKEYQEKFVKPLESARTKLVSIASDYGLPEEVMDKAVSFTNQRDLNGFLSQHFDDVGAMEVKQLVNGVKALQAEAKDAENEPERVLQQMAKESKILQETTKQKRYDKISTQVRGYWSDTITDIQSKDDAIGLKFRDGNTEWNDNVVKPLLSQAAKEYGKIATMLAELGIEDIPENLGKALASMVARSHDSAISNVKFKEVSEQLRLLQTNSRNMNALMRPGVGSPGRPSAPDAGAPAVPRDAGTNAKVLLNKVGL